MSNEIGNLELELMRLQKKVDILSGRLNAHIRETSANPPEYSKDFEEWYLVYPRKVNKKEAFHAWRDTEAQRPDLDTLIKHTRAFIQTIQKEDRPLKFIPHPASWLRRHGWTDDESKPYVPPPPVPIRPAVMVNQQAPDWGHHSKWIAYVADVMDNKTTLYFKEWLHQKWPT